MWAVSCIREKKRKYLFKENKEDFVGTYIICIMLMFLCITDPQYFVNTLQTTEKAVSM